MSAALAAEPLLGAAASSEPYEDGEKQPQGVTATLQVSGMTCGACVEVSVRPSGEGAANRSTALRQEDCRKCHT
jgi:hypothetical protein